MLQELSNPTMLDGVNFDIEGLLDEDYMDLFYTMRETWNRIIKSSEKGSHMLLRFNFGNEQEILAADAVKENLLDRIYWESYQSNSNLMLGDANTILGTINNFVDDKDNRVLLAFETNCCLQPCIDATCYSCHTKPLPEWEIKSFGLCGSPMPPTSIDYSLDSPRVKRVNYLLDTLDAVENGLKSEGLLHVMDRNFTTGFVAYNYRGLKILLENVDDGTDKCPGASLHKIRGNVSNGQ